MLNAMREGARSGLSKFILFGFMTVAVGGLVLMDVGGFFRGGVTRTTVAKIDGNELSIVTFDQHVRRILQKQGLDTGTAYQLGYITQILDGEINSNLIQHKANDLGLVVSDKVVIKKVNEFIEPYLNETTDRKTALTTILMNQGMSERDFIRMIKGQMTNGLLQNALRLGASAPPQSEALDMYLYNNEARTVKTLYLPYSKIKNLKEPVDEILLPLYQAGQEKYAIPETRTFTVATLSTDKIKKTLDISDEELHSVYDRDIESYKVPEKRLLQQAIVDNEAAATKVAADAKDGDLKAAVKKETGKEDAYLGEEKFEKQGLMEDISAPVFTASKGDVVGPVQTALGWHVIVVKDIDAPFTRPFDEVKKDLRKDLIDMRLADEMLATANSIDDALAGGATLEDVAKTMDLSVKQYGPIRNDGSTPDSKDGVEAFGDKGQSVAQTVFELAEGEISPVMELADGSYAAVRADKITEKTYTPFEKVKAELSATWMKDQRDVEAKLMAEEALKALNLGEKQLDDVAKEWGVSVQSHKLVRSEDVKEPFVVISKTLFFELPVNAYGTAPGTDGYVLGQIAEATLPDEKSVTGEKLKPVLETVESGNEDEMLQMYVRELRERYDVVVNERLLDTTYAPGGEQQF